MKSPATTNAGSPSAAAAAANSVNSLLAYTRPDTSASPTSLCVSVQRSQASIELGKTAKWIVSVWAKSGNVSDVNIHLSVVPATQLPTFSFGCGSHDGTAACSVGGVDSSSSPRQLQAGVSVAATATTVTSLQLTATATATNLASDPKASATVQVTRPSRSTSTSGTTTSTSAATNLPYVNGVSGRLDPGSSISPGGNASGLFPTLNPTSPTGRSGSTVAQRANARPAADISALSLGKPMVGAQLAGLGALAVGFILAVTRLSVRRRPTPKPPAE